MRIRNLSFQLECTKSKVMKKKKFLPSRPSLKTGVGNDIVWSEIESGFGEPGAPSTTKNSRKYPLGLSKATHFLL